MGHSTGVCLPLSLWLTGVDWKRVYEAALSLDAETAKRLARRWRERCKAGPHKRKSKDVPWYVASRAFEIGVSFSTLLEAGLEAVYGFELDNLWDVYAASMLAAEHDGGAKGVGRGEG